MTWNAKQTTEPIGQNEYGDETHPSWVTIRASRPRSTPGARLFDSSIPHSEYVTVCIATATRKRDLHHDFIYSAKTIMELDMSMAQWGAFVSSFGDGSGVPVTLHYTAEEGMVPQEPHDTDSRLALSAKETRTAVTDAIAAVQQAEAAVMEAFESKAGRKELGDLLRDLHYKIENMPENAKFAADTLTKHAEDVTTKARFDIEAMVAQHAQTLGISAAPIVAALQLEEGHDDL